MNVLFTDGAKYEDLSKVCRLFPISCHVCWSNITVASCIHRTQPCPMEQQGGLVPPLLPVSFHHFRLVPHVWSTYRADYRCWPRCIGDVCAADKGMHSTYYVLTQDSGVCWRHHSLGIYQTIYKCIDIPGWITKEMEFPQNACISAHLRWHWSKGGLAEL